MPVVKPISGHTSCRGIFRYLTKDGRALATDLYNLSWDETRDAGLDEELKAGIDWASEMDFTRAAFGNDRPWKGLRARTYKHYVLSPDPDDRIGLAEMRELAGAWVRENFPDYQSAVVIHDDNENGIMHAHVVVNNTNLVTGNRLQDPNPRALKASAQRLAEKRGMRFFADESGEEILEGRVSRARAANLEACHYRRAERELGAKGSYSWVADIRNRVGIAKEAAGNVDDFRKVLSALGIDVSDASPKDGKADWLYTLSGHDTWRIRGENLGTAYGKQAVEAGFILSGAPSNSDAIRRIAESAIEVGDLDDLGELAWTLDMNRKYGIRSISDYAARIGELKSGGETARASELERARSYSERKGLLPESKPKPKPPSRRRPPKGGDQFPYGGRAPSPQAKQQQQREAARRQEHRRGR